MASDIPVQRFGQEIANQIDASETRIGPAQHHIHDSSNVIDLMDDVGNFYDQNLLYSSLDFKGGGKGGGTGGNKGKNFDPDAVDHQGSTDEGSLLSIALLDGASDKNGDPLTVTAINGQSVTVNTWIGLDSGARIYLGSDGNLLYDSQGAHDYLDQDEVALENLNYTISDSKGGTDTSLITIEVTGVSDAPLGIAEPDAINDIVEVSANSVTTIQVLENDVDEAGGGLTVIGIDGIDVTPGTQIHLASGAVLSINADGTLSYDLTASSPFGDVSSVEDSFSYTVQDANGQIDTAVASIHVVEAVPQPEPNGDPEPLPYYIDALLAGDAFRLNAADDYGTPTTVTFGFADAVPWYYPSSSFPNNGFESFSELQRDATRDILKVIEETTGLTFVEDSADNAEMIFGLADLPGDTRGTAYFPTADGDGLYDSDVWIDTNIAGDEFVPGSLGHVSLLHEIGHAVGLNHPDWTLLTGDEDTREYTVMSYGEHTGTEAEPESLALYDIASLQHIYGSNETATAGDDVYSLNDEVLTIWDAGGDDTLDLSMSAQGATINLDAGSFSSTAGQEDNIAVAFGTTIENAVGTDFDDIINGNEADNIITGGAGSDVLTGGAGADRFTLGIDSGNDIVTDFISGEDQLKFDGITLEDLFISTTENATTISYSGGSISLTSVEEVVEEDFLFA